MASAFGSSRVCVVCCCDPKNWHNDRYHVYVLEFYETVSEFSFRAPTLRISSSVGLKVFCVLGNMLYMFEGYIDRFDPYKCRSVLVFPLPAHNVFNIVVERENLALGSLLNHPKREPCPIVTPDGKKILIFSSKIRPDDHNHCEIYDMDIGSWHTLPGIVDAWRMNIEIFIESHTFANSVLLIQTKSGIFFLDTKLPYQPFGRLSHDVGIPIPPRLSCNYFVTIASHGLFLSAHRAHYGPLKFLRIPYISSLGGDYLQTRRCIALNYLDDKTCKFSIVQTEISRQTSQPFFIVNMYRLDLMEYVKEMERVEELEYLPATTILSSFKFCGYPEELEDWLIPLAFHPVF